MNAHTDRHVLNCRGIRLDCRPGLPQGAHVMGILNVTPDSFSDGGAFTDPSAALRRVEAMIGEGAVLIDVGGESTRPRGKTYGAGAEAVTEDQEKRRVIPVIKAIHRRFPETIISVDTYKPGTARAAVAAGAHLINDVTGLRLYPEMAQVAREARAPLILMHSLGRPGEMPHQVVYDDVVEAVQASLQESLETGRQAGLTQMIIDPGFGFGKSPAENLRLLNHMSAFLALGHPVLVGISRKSTIGIILGQPGAPVPVEGRLFGTLGATAVAVLNGAAIVRTHDVRPTVEMLKTLAETARA